MLFLPVSETLPLAPFKALGPSDEPDDVYGEEAEEAASRLASSAYRPRPILADWRRILAVSKAKCGPHLVRFCTVWDAKAGFGRWKLPGPGSFADIETRPPSRNTSLKPVHVPGITGNASDMIARRALEKLEFRNNIRELIKKTRPTFLSATAPRNNMLISKTKAAAAAAYVVEGSASIKAKVDKGKSGMPDDIGESLYKLYRWNTVVTVLTTRKRGQIHVRLHQ